MIISDVKVSRVKEVYTIAEICDFCGATSAPFGPMTSFSIHPGYGSQYDCDKFSYEICDRCLSNLVSGREICLRTIDDSNS